MNEMLNYSFLVLATGVLAGAFFFGGLWWTIRKVLHPNTGTLVLCSLSAAMSITLAGFYFITRGHWERILLCLLFGFVIARFIVMRLTGHWEKIKFGPAQEDPS